MSARRAAASLAALCLLAGCGFPQFDPPSLVTTVRILAIKAEPPEVAPGESVVVTTAVFDPLGAPLMFWTVCTPDPVAGASACAEDLSTSGGMVAGGLLGPMITVDIPIDALAGADDPTALAVASLIVCSGGDPTMGGDPNSCFPKSTGDAGAGDAGVAFEEIPENIEIGIKRITVSDTVTPNQNPMMASISVSINAMTLIDLGTDTFECGPGLDANRCIGAGAVVEFTLLSANGSIEDYVEVVDGKDQARTEELITSFFATSGRFTSIRAVGAGMDGLEATNDWSSAPPAEDPGPVAKPGELVRFWFVVRDGRGGTDFVERTIGVVP